MHNPLLDPFWRINNLYQIVDKRGHKITFKLNWAQEELYKNMWYCNVVLKARQLGISTFICLLFLDRCLFNPDVSAGIIAHTVEDGQALFRRVKIAYDSLPDQIKNVITADNDTSQMLKFSNGSSLRVGTSLRSSTFQYLHISEFGKICAKYPDKAQEIITGSLNTVAAGQYVFIESTAEGRSGYFYDICKQAQDKRDKKTPLSELDFKFHFFPWYGEKSYRTGSIFPITKEIQDYFDHLEMVGISLEDEQKHWYIARAQTQAEDMHREYPSTPEESWQVSNEGLYYSKHMTNARIEKRIGNVAHNEQLETHTAWDLGWNDANAIIFFQILGKELRIIDYEEGSGESLPNWIQKVKSKPYTYGKHIAPHDILQTEYGSGFTRQSIARKLGMNFLPAEKTKIIPGIDAVRALLPFCWFDEKKCDKLIKALDNYKKEWDDRHACWRSEPLHNWASHGCFAGETLLLTRSGRLPIMLIEKDMEILTLKGWKKCNKAVVTKKNAQLVEVKLSDGMIVKCTPDHLFLTEKGWISAVSLEKDLKIRSSLTCLQHIFEDLYIGYGHKRDILKRAVHIYTEMFGKALLGIFLKDVIFTTKIMISKIINFQTWNVCPTQYTSSLNDLTLSLFLTRQEMEQENGINLKLEGNGIDVKQSDQKAGQNGKEKKKNVQYAKSFINLLLEKVVILKSIVQQNVNPLRVLDVKKLDNKEDVYCINVPDIHHFSLANGAIVHNSDAFRTLATGMNLVTAKTDMSHKPSEYLRDRFNPGRM